MSEEANKDDVQEETISKAEYDKQVERARNFEAKLTDYEKKEQELSKLGSIDDIKGKLADYNNIRKQSATTPEEVEALIEEERARWREELATKEKALKETDARLHKEVVVNKISTEWANEFTADGLKIAQELYISKHIKKDADGYYIVDESDKPRYNGVNRMTPEDYLLELKEIVPSLFADKGEVGTAKRGSASASKDNTSKPMPKGLSQAEKIDYFKNNPDYNVWK